MKINEKNRVAYTCYALSGNNDEICKSGKS